MSKYVSTVMCPKCVKQFRVLTEWFTDGMTERLTCPLCQKESNIKDFEIIKNSPKHKIIHVK